MKQQLKAFFHLSHQEQKGIIALSILIFLLSLVRIGLQFYENQQAVYIIDESQWEERLAYEHRLPKGKSTQFFFSFDPNTLSVDSLQLLGISQSISQTIANYREKGGKFYQKEDLLGIYYFDTSLYNQLVPYISIEKNYNSTFNSTESKMKVITYKSTTTFTPIELNTCDSAKLTSLYGIGPVYASRIIKYRNLLGGFVDKAQLLEVYGIDSTLYLSIHKKVTIENLTISQIKINTAEWKDIVKHPYIDKDKANLLLNYRNEHGAYENFAILIKNNILTAEFVNKITPYIDFSL